MGFDIVDWVFSVGDYYYDILFVRYIGIYLFFKNYQLSFSKLLSRRFSITLQKGPNQSLDSEVSC